MKRLFLITLLVSVVALCVYAGWEHSSGKTYWVNRATAATYWLRDSKGDVYIAEKVQVFHDSIQHDDEGSITTDFGFWLKDENGDLIINPDITNADCTTNRTANGEWMDVEWDIDGNGDLIPKP